MFQQTHTVGWTSDWERIKGKLSFHVWKFEEHKRLGGVVIAVVRKKETEKKGTKQFMWKQIVENKVNGREPILTRKALLAGK